MANYSAYAKKYGDLMSDYNKKWKGKISLSQYGKMHYDAYGKKEGRKMPGGSSGGSGGRFTVGGVTYPVGISGSFMGRNPNKGYKARATLEGGSTKAEDNVNPGAIGGLNMQMTKRGQRVIYRNGVSFIERDPGSGVFTSANMREEGGTLRVSEWTHREPEKPEPPKKKKSGGSRKSTTTPPPQKAPDPITSSLDAYIASLMSQLSSAADYVSGLTATALAAQNPAEDLGVASGSGISSTVLTSGVTEETSPSVLTPVSAKPTAPYAGSSTLTEGTQVVDTVNGKVYPNKASALAAGVKAWMPKTQWDALQASE